MTTTEISILARGEAKKRFELPGVRVVEEMSEKDIEQTRNLFVVSSALALPDVASIVKAANRLKHLRGLFIEHDHDAHWVTTMLNRADLRTLRHTVVHENPQVFIRILNAWKIGAQKDLIADATIQGNRLFVKSCALDDIDVDIRDIEPLIDAAKSAVLEFEVSEDGANIYWPHLDVHLDLESIRVAKDPALQAKFRAQRMNHDQQMGAAIKVLRQRDCLRQTDIEGISARQVRRIEKGAATPRSDTLHLFARAHGLEVNDYLNQLADQISDARCT